MSKAGASNAEVRAKRPGSKIGIRPQGQSGPSPANLQGHTLDTMTPPRWRGTDMYVYGIYIYEPRTKHTKTTLSRRGTFLHNTCQNHGKR